MLTNNRRITLHQQVLVYLNNLRIDKASKLAEEPELVIKAYLEPIFFANFFQTFVM